MTGIQEDLHMLLACIDLLKLLGIAIVIYFVYLIVDSIRVSQEYKREMKKMEDRKNERSSKAVDHITNRHSNSDFDGIVR